MSLRLRLIDPRRTFIARLRRSHGEVRSRLMWVAIHGRQKREMDWGALLSRALDLLMEEPVLDDGVTFAEGAGSIIWQRHAFWTIIRLEMSVYSRKKRGLIAAALLKVARQGF